MALIITALGGQVKEISAGSATYSALRRMSASDRQAAGVAAFGLDGRQTHVKIFKNQCVKMGFSCIV
jgi:hypothetical protein